MHRMRRFARLFTAALLALAVSLPTGADGPLGAPPADAAHTAPPGAVTIAGSLQSELGCPGDWQPGCAATQLAFDATDDVWARSFLVPPGSWEYKAALNNDWAENYGANGTQDGPNIGLTLLAPTTV